MGLFTSNIGAIRKGLAKTRQTLAAPLRSILLGKALSDELIDEIETHLITADVGVGTTAAIIGDLREAYRKGGVAYGEVKKRVAELFEGTFGPARERREKLAADPDAVEDVLVAGAKSARAIAKEVMHDVRQACGIVTSEAVRS